jgi:hypothetical protein
MLQLAPFLAEGAAGPALLIAGDRHPIRAPGAAAVTPALADERP